MGDMERIYKQGLLYDFYGELLTEHQRTIYEDAVYNDMSLSEIASEQGISRQGVHDLIKRCDKILAGYEEKLRLVEKFTKAKESISHIADMTGELLNEDIPEHTKSKIEDIRKVSVQILEDF